MSIELASLDIPIQVLGVPQAGAQLAAVEAVGKRTEVALNGLSRRGIRLVETGFQALAFQATGVPGPLGRIAQGALLLGGGSGLLLGVAAAAGTLGIAWMALTHRTDEQTAALDRMTKAIDKRTQASKDMNAADQAYRKDSGLGKFFTELSGATAASAPLSNLLGNLGNYFTGRAAAVNAVANAYTTLVNNQDMDARFAAASQAFERDLARQTQLRNELKQQREETARQAAEFRATVTKAITTQPELARDNFRDHRTSAQRVEDAVTETRFNRELADSLREVGLALNEVGDATIHVDPAFQALTEAGKQMGATLNGVVLGAITGIAAGIGAALAGEGNIGDAMVGALGAAFQQFGAALIVGATIITKALAALATHPWAAIGLGAALVAVGAMLSAKANASFGSGYGTSASGTGGGYGLPPWSDTSVNRSIPAGATPGAGAMVGRAASLRPAQAVQQFFTIIGPNDPSVQRQVKLAYEGAMRRGV